MFYKNILETVPIYMYGILSLFSGVVIYNELLYVSFNTIYTSLPVIWFATMDLEYPKVVHNRTPRLYRIGMEDRYFNDWVFWRWIFYAIWQSSLMLFLAYYALEGSSPSDTGFYGGIWVPGELVYGALVIVSNMKIVISSYRINFGLVVLVLLSVYLYILSYFLISFSITLSDEYGTFYMMMSAP